MNKTVPGFLVLVSLISACVPAVAQTPAPKKAARPPENLPWTRFHRADPPYQPTDAEKQQIESKIGQLDAAIRELKSRQTDDGLLADVEIYCEAARWKMAYPQEFFRQKSVADTLAVLDKGLERAAQLKEGKSPWTTQTGLVARGFRSAIDGTVQPVRVTVPADYDGKKVFPLDVKAGDKILFGKYSGTEIRLDGEEFLIMREEEVLGIIK